MLAFDILLEVISSVYLLEPFRPSQVSNHSFCCAVRPTTQPCCTTCFGGVGPLSLSLSATLVCVGGAPSGAVLRCFRTRDS